MPRYNSVWAGPSTQTQPQTTEALAAVDLTPGLLVTRDGTGKFALAVAATNGAVYVVQENFLTLKGVDTAIPANQTAVALVMLDEQLFNLRFATGINVIKDAAISIGAGGTPILATAGTRIIGYADETYNNTSGQSQLVRVRPASGRAA